MEGQGSVGGSAVPGSAPLRDTGNCSSGGSKGTDRARHAGEPCSEHGGGEGLQMGAKFVVEGSSANLKASENGYRGFW